MKHVFKKNIFSWGQKDLVHKNQVRRAYITALQKADKGLFNDLINFSIQ